MWKEQSFHAASSLPSLHPPSPLRPPSSLSSRPTLLRLGSRSPIDDPTKLRSLADEQVALVLHAMRFPSVTSVTYSTCSIHDIENEAVVQRVLTAQRGVPGGGFQVLGASAFGVRAECFVLRRSARKCRAARLT